MNDAVLLQLGIGGIFAILVLKEVFNFLNNKKKNGTTEKMATQIADLYSSMRANEAMERSINELARNIREQTYLLHQVSVEMREMREQLRALRHD